VGQEGPYAEIGIDAFDTEGVHASIRQHGDGPIVAPFAGQRASDRLPLLPR
jgi:hypothetical protein